MPLHVFPLPRGGGGGGALLLLRTLCLLPPGGGGGAASAADLAALLSRLSIALLKLSRRLSGLDLLPSILWKYAVISDEPKHECTRNVPFEQPDLTNPFFGKFGGFGLEK